jgi:hypothetical protein
VHSGCALPFTLHVSRVPLQMADLTFDDVGKRQVAVEEAYMLGKGIVHPYNRL